VKVLTDKNISRAQFLGREDCDLITKMFDEAAQEKGR
jgi:hypothetical protein